MNVINEDTLFLLQKITNKKTNDEDMFDMLSTEEQIQLNDMLNTLLKEWYIRHMKYQK